MPAWKSLKRVSIILEIGLKKKLFNPEVAAVEINPPIRSYFNAVRFFLIDWQKLVSPFIEILLQSDTSSSYFGRMLGEK